MVRLLALLVSVVVLAGGSFYFVHTNVLHAPGQNISTVSISTTTQKYTNTTASTVIPATQVAPSEPVSPAVSTTKNSEAATHLAPGQTVYTNDQLLALASNPYANGSVPLGDYKYVTDAPKKGYVYLCHTNIGNAGSNVLGPWVHGSTWNFLEKIAVSGTVVWPNASFNETLSAAYRVLTGNDLPINGITTGTFPVQKTDVAYQYDPNPNTISAQTLSDDLPANPTYSQTPYCMGGEVGVMQDGVALFDAFDAGLRDAPAHELQDSCDGHPQGSGEYHYHSLSACFTDIGEETVLGFAYDGFPITGPLVAPGKYLTTDNLDECHGITSEINLDGKKVITYHYVMTQDFPYSVSCFRGKPITTGPSVGTQTQTQLGAKNYGGNSSQTQAGNPPQAALDACLNKGVDAACSIATPQGNIQGTCRTPPNSSLACIPD